MPKKFASGSGIRSYSRAQASPSGMPMVWVSMMVLNSLLSGLGEAAGEREGLLLPASGVEFLQRSLDLLAARALAFLDLTRRSVGTCDRGAAGFGLLLA